jgi:hypothetical protein
MGPESNNEIWVSQVGVAPEVVRRNDELQAAVRAVADIPVHPEV